jgi:hypothetical protein
MAIVVGSWWSCLTTPSRSAAPPLRDGKIARWVQQLDDDQFAVREAAHANLLRAGRPAIPAVSDAASSGSLEVTTRVFRIFRSLVTSMDNSTAEAAREALMKLTASGHPQVAARARQVLRAELDHVARKLREAGCSVEFKGDRVVYVSLNSVAKVAPLVPLLRCLPDVQALSGRNRQVDDAVLAQLTGMRKLEDLNLFESGLTDEGLKLMKHFPDLRSVQMGHTKVTDAGLKHLENLTQLEYVGLRENHITDAGLVHLRKLTNLTGLYLGGTKVTNAGLKHLTGMTKMNYLRLYDVVVTDAGLDHLVGMTMLEQLELWGTKVTSAGVDRLQKALPKLQIRMKGSRR